jgi:hypothetical protein
LQSGETPASLARLGYDSKWWEYGFLDEQRLRSQIARLDAGDDPNTEHYRYAAFLQILETRTAFDDLTLARFVELAVLDRDRVMATSVLIQLARWPGLTEEQRGWLREQPALAAPIVQRAFDWQSRADIYSESLTHLKHLATELRQTKPVDWSIILRERRSAPELAIRPADQSIGKFRITWRSNQLALSFFSRALNQWNKQAVFKDNPGNHTELWAWMIAEAAEPTKRVEVIPD